MRTIEEIKSDLKDCYSCESKACLFPETTHCGNAKDYQPIKQQKPQNIV